MKNLISSPIPKSILSLMVSAVLLAGCAATPTNRLAHTTNPHSPTLYNTPNNAPNNNAADKKAAEFYNPENNSGNNFENNIRNDDKIRVALLLPLTHEHERVRNLARDMFNAGLLALFDSTPHTTPHQTISLSLHDTKGTSAGAQAAMQEAIAHDAALVIGPLFAYTAQAIMPLVRTHRIPTLTFSNDSRLIDHNRPDHLWLLGFLPEQSMERISRAAIAQGLTRFGALVPDGDYGMRSLRAFETHISRYGGAVIQAETYPIDAQSMFEPVRRLARFESRRAAYQAKRTALIAEAQVHARKHDIVFTPSDDEQENTDKLFAAIAATAPHLLVRYEDISKRETEGEIVYDAIFIPEGGLALRSLAPLLPYYDIDPRFVKFIGTSLWDEPALAREPSLHGGWYAAPDENLKDAFRAHFAAIYDYTPPRIAALAYDAVALAARLAALNTQDPFAPAILTDPNGFRGIEGIMRLTPDGGNERGLAIYEITSKKPRRITPPPSNFVEHDRDIRAALSLPENLNQ